MKRASTVMGILLLAGTLAQAQIGKMPVVKAGSPEDRLLAQITAESDMAKRLPLLDQFVKEFGSSEVVQIGYELYQSTYLRMKDYDHSIEYGEKVLAIDPENAVAMANLVRAAQEKGDTEKVVGYAERLGQLVTRVQTMAPPEALSADDWARRRDDWMASIRNDFEYAEYTLFTTAVAEKDPTRKIGYLDRFASAYPHSSFRQQLDPQYALAYQQKGDLAKMTEYADKVLQADPNNTAVLLLVGDTLSDRGVDLPKATASAKKVLDLVQGELKKPEQMNEEQWAEQKKVSEGLAHSILGEVYLRQNKTPAATAEFRAASPLLKSDSLSYARNLYRLGFLYARLNLLDQARTVLTEAASIPGPYQEPSRDVLEKVNRARAGRRRPER